MERNSLKLNAPWDEVKEMLKELNTDLTDEDLEYRPNGEQEMLERVARKLDQDVPHVKEWIESVSSNRGLAH